jgi:hypothetical protein
VEEVREAYWQALSRNIPGDNVEIFLPEPNKGMEAFKIRLAENQASVPPPATARTSDQLISLAPFLSHLGIIWRSRVLCSTTGGRLDFASRDVVQGDQLCVLFGLPRFYVFSPCQ